jgi:acetylornithine deacetylase
MDASDRARAILAELVAFPSVSSEPNAAIAAFCADRLADAGADVEWMPDATGDKVNLWARIGPEGPGGLILSGHLDVVPADGQAWSADPFALTARDGRLHGRGTCDMKGFLACVLAAAPGLAAARLPVPVWVALTHDEEVGCIGAQRLVAALAARDLAPAMAWIGEPTGMSVVEAHKGCCEYTVTFTGRAGHGSQPASGVNAVLAAHAYVGELTRLAAALRDLAPAANPFDPPFATVNVGQLAGGSAHNVIPDRAELKWDLRPLRDQDRLFVRTGIDRFVAESLLPGMRAVAPEADVRTEVVGEIAPLLPTQGNRMRDLLGGLGCPPAPAVAFGTEAGLFQALGADTVVCGPGHIDQAHKPDEYVETAQLARCLRVLERLPAALARHGG